MEKFLLRNVGVPNSHEIDVYIERGGYRALAKALKEFEPRELVNLVRQSGLRGRGGAGFALSQRTCAGRDDLWGTSQGNGKIHWTGLGQLPIIILPWEYGTELYRGGY